MDDNLAALRAAYPRLPTGEVTPIESGQHQRVLLLDDALLVRFLYFATGAAYLCGEAALLDAPRPHNPLPRLDFRLRQRGPIGGGVSFFGYRKRRGEAA